MSCDALISALDSLLLEFDPPDALYSFASFHSNYLWRIALLTIPCYMGQILALIATISRKISFLNINSGFNVNIPGAWHSSHLPVTELGVPRYVRSFRLPWKFISFHCLHCCYSAQQRLFSCEKQQKHNDLHFFSNWELHGAELVEVSLKRKDIHLFTSFLQSWFESQHN